MQKREIKKRRKDVSRIILTILSVALGKIKLWAI